MTKPQRQREQVPPATPPGVIPSAGALIAAIKTYDMEESLCRWLPPGELIPLIELIRNGLESLTLGDLEKLSGKETVRQQCEALTPKWPDASQRVLRDYIVHMGQRLSRDLLFFHRAGILSYFKKGNEGALRLLDFSGAQKLSHPITVELINKAAKANDRKFLIRLGEKLRKIKKSGERTIRSVLDKSENSDWVTAAEFLVKYWTSLERFPQQVTFPERRHHQPYIGLCHFSNVAMDNFYHCVIPDGESNIAKIQSRDLRLTKYCDHPLITTVYRKPSTGRKFRLVCE
jgi:hypothetical protein